MSRAAEPTTTRSGGRRVDRPPNSQTLHRRCRRVFLDELHEGDEEIYSDVILASESEMDPDEFFEVVQSICRRVQDSYNDDTLIEAIAVELERDHGFIFISDERLTAAVNVSVEEAENFLAEVGPVDDDAEARDADYRAAHRRIRPRRRPGFPTN